MGKRYPILVRDQYGIQLYSIDWALSSNEYEAKLKMDHHYYKNGYEFLGLLKSDKRLAQTDRAEQSLLKRIWWFLCSIKRVFKANILEGQEYDVCGKI